MKEKKTVFQTLAFICALLSAIPIAFLMYFLLNAQANIIIFIPVLLLVIITGIPIYYSSDYDEKKKRVWKNLIIFMDIIQVIVLYNLIKSFIDLSKPCDSFGCLGIFLLVPFIIISLPLILSYTFISIDFFKNKYPTKKKE